jgi:methionyl-tRNA formyltransferase
MKILFLGQKPLGQACFLKLIAESNSGLIVCGAVSNESLQNWWQENAIFLWAQENGMPFIANEQRNDNLIREFIIRHQIDCLISVQHAWILPGDILDLVRGQAFNIHLAKLPEYKGWHGVSHALLNEEKNYTVSLHWMVNDVDSGAIAYEKQLDIFPHDTARSLYARAGSAGLDLFEQLLMDLKLGREVPKHPLQGTHRFYDRKAIDRYRILDPATAPEKIERVARALYFPPYEPASLNLPQGKLYLIPEREWAK